MFSAFRPYSWRGSLCRCLTASQWNVEGGRQYVAWLVFFLFLLLVYPLHGLIGLTGWIWPSGYL